MTLVSTAILGIPVDNLSMDEAIGRICDMIASYDADHRPRYVATVNLDFISNILSWKSSPPRHPELMHILRKADMVTADGMPIVWASRWLGAPLKMRVAGSDLVPKLVEAAAANGKSVYFLGGRRFEMTAYRAARVLKKKHSGLLVAGIDAPWVHTAGEALAQAEEEDIRIVENINAAKPDILLIAFGSPKQEIWFDRNRHRLRVPVAIGVGATFDFLAGTMARAPLWMQQSGLEWLFRLSQEPGRLWKRYLIDLVKFGVLIWPSVLQRWGLGIRNVISKSPPTHPPRDSNVSRKHAALDPVSLPLPAYLNTAGALLAAPPGLHNAANIRLDFGLVNAMDAGGIGTLARVWQQADARGVGMAVAGLSSRHRSVLSIHRLADYFKSPCRPSFSYEALSLPDNIVLLKFHGEMDTQQVADLDYRQLLEDIGRRDCIVDIAGLSYIGSSGLMLLLHISKQTLRQGKCFVICSPQPVIKQLFLMTDLNRLFVILSDSKSAMRFIHEVQGEAEL